MPKFRFPSLGDLLGTSDKSPDYKEPPALVIVGLGNPGPKYAKTRHNVGFWCVELLAKGNGIKLERSHKTSLIGEGIVEGQRVILVKPRTFVNRSGQAIEYLLARYGVDYVYVGPRERDLYGEQGLGKFSSFMETVFSEGGVVIYHAVQ